MNTSVAKNVDPALDREYRPRLRQLMPLLFERRRAVQIGDVRKHTESATRRRLACYQGFVYFLWAVTLFLVGLGVFFVFAGNAIGAMLAFEFAACGGMAVFAAKGDQFVPARRMILRNGLLLRSSKDRRVFVPWQSICDFGIKYHFRRSRILVRTEETVHEIHAENDALLPFLTELLDKLPDGIDRTPLLELHRKFRGRTIHDRFFRSVESNLVFATILCIPVIMALAMNFPATEIGFPAWFAMMGVVLAVTFGVYMVARNRMRLRHEKYLDELLDELDRIDARTVLEALRTMPPDFGPPPRTVSKKARRTLLVFGEAGIILAMYGVIFSFFPLIFAGILFATDKAELRYGFLPFRWEKAGEGRIAEIADSSTEKAPNGGPAASGRDVITLEQTLPDGRTIRCRNPGWPPQGRFQAGQAVPLLRYRGEPECLLLDDPFSYNEMYLSLGFACFALTLIVVAVLCTAYFAASRRRHVIRLLETAPVERFRIGMDKKRAIAVPDAVGREPIPITGLDLKPGETVNVFVDEERPKKSFIAESSWSSLTWNPETGEIDSVSDRPYRIAQLLAGIFLIGVGLVFLRLFLVY